MNLGYQIDHFNKLAAEGNEGRAILNTAKYGQRIADLAMNPANGIVLSDRSTKTLQLAREIISEVKKDDVFTFCLTLSGRGFIKIVMLTHANVVASFTTFSKT